MIYNVESKLHQLLLKIIRHLNPRLSAVLPPVLTVAGDTGQGYRTWYGRKVLASLGMDPHCVFDRYNTSAAWEIRGVSCKWAVVTVSTLGIPFIHPHYVVSPPPDLLSFCSVGWFLPPMEGLFFIFYFCTWAGKPHLITWDSGTVYGMQ